MKKFDHNEQQLFAQIAVDIKKHPKNYRDAGKWLDNVYRQRQREELKKLRKQKKTLPKDKFERRENELKSNIQRRPPLFLFEQFRETSDQLLKKYKDEQPIWEDDVKKIILITWLGTDPDAEKANLHVTQLEKWPWESTDNVAKFWSRKYAILRWEWREDWMKLARRAWTKLDSLKPARTEEKKKGILRRVSKIFGAITVSIFAAVVTDILGHFGLIKWIWTIVHNILTSK